ncbi:MAG TPA: hypothetical protein ACFYEK_01240 [Candidatus Wunengus sp. YC60]|uniref:hypothetical protein n=1 Tax=Candidatus Wunengus sp. YC60 TaxID=3367697 RepID=UPI004029AE84
MKKHTQIYLSYFDYGPEDFIPSEISGLRAQDVHHIENRKAGGDPNGDKDKIENLMALTRAEHLEYGDVPDKLEWLREIHLNFMKTRIPHHENTNVRQR